MNIQDGFYIDNLDINYINNDSDFTSERKDFDEYYRNNSYRIFWQIRGSTKISINGKQIIARGKSITLIKPIQKFKFEYDLSKSFELMTVSVHSSLIQDNDDKEFFRAFENSEKFNSTILLSEYSSKYIKSLLYSIKKCIINSSGKIHIVSRIIALISEMSFYYDEKYSNKIVPTDNLAVKIIKYIDSRYNLNISYEKISAEFFVSKSTINKIVTMKTGKSFWNYVVSKRMEDAKKMLGYGRFSARQIALLCGYNDYTGFYRAYKKYYGISPKIDKHKKNKSWPLT